MTHFHNPPLHGSKCHQPKSLHRIVGPLVLRGWPTIGHTKRAQLYLFVQVLNHCPRLYQRALRWPKEARSLSFRTQRTDLVSQIRLPKGWPTSLIYPLAGRVAPQRVFLPFPLASLLLPLFTPATISEPPTRLPKYKMSLSTSCLGSAFFCTCCSSGMSGLLSTPRTSRGINHAIVVQDNQKDGVLEAWKQELNNKIIKNPNIDAESFLRKYVPSNAPPLVPANLDTAFADWIPSMRREVDDYPHIVRTHSCLCSCIDLHCSRSRG